VTGLWCCAGLECVAHKTHAECAKPDHKKDGSFDWWKYIPSGEEVAFNFSIFIADLVLIFLPLRSCEWSYYQSAEPSSSSPAVSAFVVVTLLGAMLVVARRAALSRAAASGSSSSSGGSLAGSVGSYGSYTPIASEEGAGHTGVIDMVARHQA